MEPYEALAGMLFRFALHQTAFSVIGVLDVHVLEMFRLFEGGYRELVVEVLLDDQAADGHTVYVTPTAVFDVYRHGDFRIVHRCEAHKHGVVMTTVLGSTRLATYFNAWQIG